MNDLIFAAGSVILILALVPTLRGAQKPKLSTCAITGFTLFTYSLNFGAMHLWLSAFLSGVSSVLWIVLADQVRAQNPLRGTQEAQGAPQTTSPPQTCVVHDPKCICLLPQPYAPDTDMIGHW